VRVSGVVTGNQSVTLSAQSDILQAAGGNLSSPNISLTSNSGNIGASGAGNAVVISNGVAGSVLFNANATANTSSAVGNIFLSSATSGTVTLDNSSSALTAGTQFNLTASGSIVQSTSGAGINSPVISLTSTGG